MKTLTEKNFEDETIIAGIPTTLEIQRLAPKSEKIRERKKRVQEEIVECCKNTPLEFKDNASKEAWAEMINLNIMNPYGKKIIKFAETWAKYMQYLKNKHNVSIEKIAKQTYYSANLGFIKDFIFESTVDESVYILGKYWVYGDELLNCFHIPKIRVMNVIIKE